jgi:hypothetical protein
MPTRTTPRGPWGPSGGGPGGGGLRLPPMTPVPRDVLAILIVVFATFTLGAFRATAVVPGILHLGRLMWPVGAVWQVFTYPFAGYGGPSLWILLELLILYWFLRDVFYQLGRRRFWRNLLTVTVTAGVVAVAVELAALLLSGGPVGAPFVIMNGQRTLLAFAIAAFATLNRDATVLLMFILPIQARWFLWIEVAIAFIAFLQTKDLAGFVGILVVVWGTYALLTAGGPTRLLREWRLRAEKTRLERQLARERKKRNLRVVKGGDERDDDSPRPGPWVH